MAVRWPDGRVGIVVNNLLLVAELGPNDAELLAAWLLVNKRP